METAAIVPSGDSQAVVLPPGIHFEGKEVYVRRLGRSVLLVPTDVNLWDVMADSLEEFTDDYLEDRSQPAPQVREAPFE